MSSISNRILQAADDLAEQAGQLTFSPPVACVYNPLVYARPGYAAYVETFARSRKRVLFMGMNPGPFGMAQVGVPFGEITHIREWMGIHAPVNKPPHEHPKRPVEGFDCERSEVSGLRLWGLFAQRFGAAERFFQDHFVVNYCPLVFMADSGKNVTPDKLNRSETAPLFEVSDTHLRAVVDIFRPEWVIGIGVFAEKRITAALDGSAQIGRILHPSPASPAANRGWAEAATRQLVALGVWHSNEN
jgi:single-strand selective monofunctional uracil DNA glycosylase